MKPKANQAKTNEKSEESQLPSVKTRPRCPPQNPESVNVEHKTPQGERPEEKKNAPTPAKTETAHGGRIKANEEAMKMAENRKPQNQDEKYTDEEKNAHESRLFPTPNGTTAKENLRSKGPYGETNSDT